MFLVLAQHMDLCHSWKLCMHGKCDVLLNTWKIWVSWCMCILTHGKRDGLHNAWKSYVRLWFFTYLHIRTIRSSFFKDSFLWIFPSFSVIFWCLYTDTDTHIQILRYPFQHPNLMGRPCLVAAPPPIVTAALAICLISLRGRVAGRCKAATWGEATQQPAGIEARGAMAWREAL